MALSSLFAFCLMPPFLLFCKNGFSAFYRTALDFLFPPVCLKCDKPVAEHGVLCPDCWKKIHFIAPPFCDRCGMPFDFPAEAGEVCGACFADPPPFLKARAAMVYDEESKNLILSFKHHDRLFPAEAYGNWLFRAALDLFEDCDLVIPVPLHRWRLWKRRYNQAALLAYAAAKLANKPVWPLALKRTRHTPPQASLGKKQRFHNVKDAFEVPLSWKQDLKGKKILLIDDVLTTGATVSACAKALLEAGADQVFVATLSRTKGLSS